MKSAPQGQWSWICSFSCRETVFPSRAALCRCERLHNVIVARTVSEALHSLPDVGLWDLGQVASPHDIVWRTYYPHFTGGIGGDVHWLQRQTGLGWNPSSATYYLLDNLGNTEFWRLNFLIWKMWMIHTHTFLSALS